MTIAELYDLFKKSNGVSTDTRNIEHGTIFFALKGERFNGNEYAIQALEQGASYAVIDEAQEEDDDRLILVDNVLYCLQDLASYHREEMEIPFIGITGSNGKTTTKELIRDVLRKNYKVLATRGNLNNHIGVPLTLLEVSEEHEIAIIEMGANHVGEIALLCAIANPDLGMITNIGKAHIGEFGGYENIIKGKTELYDHLRMMEGTVFVNGESPILMEKSSDIERVIYGNHLDSEVVTESLPSATFLSFKWENRTIDTKLVGAYNLSNMNAAISIGRYFQVDDKSIINALESYDPDNNRSQLLEKNGNRIILDAYNANPTSMKAAIDNLSEMKAAKKFAILGHMLELGDDSETEHRHLIELTRIKGVNSVFIGSEFQKLKDVPDGIKIFESVDDAKDHFLSLDIEDTLILIKGSRGIKLEDSLEFL